MDEITFPGQSSLCPVLDALRSMGGKPYIVGGWVRDLILNIPSGDLDIEVFNLSPDGLKSVLERFGSVNHVGRAFGVFKISGAEIEFSLPRVDSKIADGHRGFAVEAIPHLSFAEASRRRDFTVNAMGFDPETGEILDPHNGYQHLQDGVLEIVDSETFSDDPLRVLRGCQLLSRYLFKPGPKFLEQSRVMGMEDLPRERIFAEFEKMFLGRKPSLGARFLRLSGWIRYFPEWAALIGVPQEPEWHPEGDVWEHVLLALDKAVTFQTGDPGLDSLLMLGVLCHDFGKARTTVRKNGKIRSIGHSEAGVIPASTFVERLTASHILIEGTKKMVREHLAPQFLYRQGAKPGAIRRLARRLAPELNIDLLVRCARADHFASGSGEDEEFQAGNWLLKQAEDHVVLHEPEPSILKGRHLIDAGLSPGPIFGRILERAYEIQTEEGERRISELLRRASSDHGCTAMGEDEDE